MIIICHMLNTTYKLYLTIIMIHYIRNMIFRYIIRIWIFEISIINNLRSKNYNKVNHKIKFRFSSIHNNSF